jgi:hypothetical protein
MVGNAASVLVGRNPSMGLSLPFVDPQIPPPATSRLTIDAGR